MNLEEELHKHGLHVSDIKKIYHGLNNACRCGCKGKYFKVGSIGFKCVINRIQKDNLVPLSAGVKIWAPSRRCMIKSEGVTFVSGTNDKFDGYLNIPYDADFDKCYCLYFKP